MIKVSEVGCVVIVMFVCFDVCNVFNEMMIVELIIVFEWFDVYEGVCVVVFVVEGVVFCVGVDLNWMKKMVGYLDDENCVDVCKFVWMFEVIYCCGKLVIVCVYGDVYVGGVGFVVVVDIVIVVDGVKFCLLEVWFGLIFVMIVLYVVCVMGECVVCCYFMMVEVFDSVCVVLFGFIYDVVLVDVFDEMVVKLVVMLVVNGFDVVKVCKWFVVDVVGCVFDVMLIE